MLTIVDCIALSGLSEGEVEAIAEHEHVPPIVAAELGCCLESDPSGQRLIAAFIRDDIAHARAHGAARHVAELAGVLQHYMNHHRGLYMGPGSYVVPARYRH